MEVFRLAAPVFRAVGYRGATIKALAHAAHLSPAALYHYFPSKLALATYPLRRDNRHEAAGHIGRPAAQEPPLERISRHLDIFIHEAPTYLLAIDLAREAGVPFDGADRSRLFREGERALVPPMLAAAPALSESTALALADDILAILVAPAVTGLAGESDSIRERMVGLLRERLIAAGVEPAELHRAMRVREPASALVPLERAG